MFNPASFWTQANALLRKNLTYQKRDVKTNVRLVLFPVILVVLLYALQTAVDIVQSASLQDEKKTKAAACKGCVCVHDIGRHAKCPDSEKVCGPRFLGPEDANTCPVPYPPEWPPLLQLEVGDGLFSNDAARNVTMLFTGTDQFFGESLFGTMFPTELSINESDIMASLASVVLGTEFGLDLTVFVDPALSINSRILYRLQQDQCKVNSSFSFNFNEGDSKMIPDVKVNCTQASTLWRKSFSDIWDELQLEDRDDDKIGYYKLHKNPISGAFDFLNSNKNIFNVSFLIYKHDNRDKINMNRTPRSVNMISNAFLKFLLGNGTKMLFDFIGEMPKPASSDTTMIDITSLLGGLFYTWVILQLFPVILISLVYEKQHKIRMMMKMHGLGDGPYWLISYAYFLAISMAYMLCFVLMGSFFGFHFFRENNYGIQFVFYFIYVNLQIASAFLVAALFSNVKPATVTAYIVVFGTGLVAAFLFPDLLKNDLFPKKWIIVFEFYPGFALFRGLNEFAEYVSVGNSSGTLGMRWQDLNDSTNGMKQILIIMSIEWIVFLFVAYYLDQVSSSASGRSPFFFLKGFQKKTPLSSQNDNMPMQGSRALAQMDKPDVIQQREKVEELLLEPAGNHRIVCNELRKVYQGRDGNPDKVAVRGLFLAVPQGECFGMLGPNGAGKTSFISMMIGLTKPTSGTAFVQGMDIRTDMNGLYTSMGVCPQHNLLWERLTGREHLLFYGRLKNLKGSALTQAVEESLKSLNLFNGGVADKQAGKYSGGMKRRLSVAISLIGNPNVVYMDEPSTGLDPASRKRLWDVIKTAKKDRAIILTTHSMEEAEALCDRLGIFVDGSLQCIGNSKELKARYGGTYVLTMTTPWEHEKEVENMVRLLCPNANKIYHISGTQKFELPKGEVRIADVFGAVDFAKRNFTVSAWGLTDTTMEDVFIKVARGDPHSQNLS
ncbi:ABC transporter A family member 7-like [Arachis duranensis]|uniref:ABC transporter A family member 7-like n=1 Tax=Arachis duranensis TaxID=130453 RepID=A0A6P4BST0_ARADU|nr:ABC transporter A family member 7-like [Arachis duranensis]